MGQGNKFGVGNMVFFSSKGVANLKGHSPIMVSVAVYAMRYATGPELPRGLSFGVGDRREGQRKNVRW